jgi:helicase MOV-10
VIAVVQGANEHSANPTNSANPTATAQQTKHSRLQAAINTTAAKFFETICKDSALRECCEDRNRFNRAFRDWKQKQSQEGNSLRGGASACLRAMKSKKWVDAGRKHQAGVLVFKGASAKGTRRSRATEAADRVRTHRAQFESNKQGVVVGEADFTEVISIGVKSKHDISITNSAPAGSNEIWLLSVVQVTKRPEFSTIPVIDPVLIDPGTSLRVSTFCAPASDGMLRTIFVFTFMLVSKADKSSTEFTIARYVQARSGNRQHLDLLQPAAPYKKKVRRPKPTHKEKVVDDPAAKPSFSKPQPWVHKLEYYDRPGSWNSMIALGEANDWFEEAQGRLSSSTYVMFFHRLLWCEEFQQAIDIRFFDIEGATLIRDRAFLQLRVLGLAENRPSVLRGDPVKIRPSHSPGKAFIGYAHHIRMEDVSLKLPRAFDRSYISGQKVDVEFQITRTPMRIFHQGVEMSRYLDSSILFPVMPSELRQSDGLSSSLTGRKPFEELNHLQQQAVSAIVEGRARPIPYVIFGPPGTGKTRTLVFAAYSFCAMRPNTRVLLCAPSNSAADLLIERLAILGAKPDTTIRIMAHSRSVNTVSEKVRPFTKTDGGGETFVFPSLDSLKTYRIVVTTVVTAGKLWNNGVERGVFAAVFIDEAGHALEPEAVAPLATLLNKDGHTILAGDPMQLGPIIMSGAAKAFGLERSLLERLIERPIYARNEDESHGGKYNPLFITKLEQNYRSHPCILELPNKLFYNGDLKVAADELITHNLQDWEHLPTKGAPIIFHGLEGQDAREGNSPSWFNADEASQVLKYVQLLLDHTKKNPVQPHEIGVISPYNKQVLKIQKLLAYEGYTGIKVASTELFQGQERRVMIISTVRSSEEFISFDQRHNLGFLTNSKRFNVAITRAKALLIVIGNPKVLSTDSNWNELIVHCKRLGAYTGSHFEPAVDDGSEPLEAIRAVDAMVRTAEAEAEDDEDDEDPSHRMQQEAGAMVRHDE